MSVHGIVLLDLIGTLLFAVVLNLVRTRRLQPAFGVLWISAIILMMVVVSVPPMLMLVTKATGAVYPASALTLLALALAFAVLIVFSVQLSKLSRRQLELAKAIALQELRMKEAIAERVEWPV
jgi:hypothetical protein